MLNPFFMIEKIKKIKYVLVCFFAIMYFFDVSSQTIQKIDSACSISLPEQRTDIAKGTDILKEYFNKRDSIIRSNIGKAYPSFIAKSVNEEKIITEEYLKRKVTLVNFWFKGCPPCINEFVDLNALNAKFNSNPLFQIISLTFDDPYDAKETIKEYSLTYLICSISKEECYRLNLGCGFPTNIIVDKDGNFSLFLSGSGRFGVLEKKIREMLEN